MAALELQPEGRSGAGRIRCRVPADGRTGWVSLRAADDGRGAVAVVVHVCDGVTEIYLCNIYLFLASNRVRHNGRGQTCCASTARRRRWRR
eukprot:COSAG01_NODE_18775_length_1053_cov_67.227463_1_plen_90_part_01